MAIWRLLVTYDDVSEVIAITERDQKFPLQSKQLSVSRPNEMARFMRLRPNSGPSIQRLNRIDRWQARIAFTQVENQTIKFRDHTHVQPDAHRRAFFHRAPGRAPVNFALGAERRSARYTEVSASVGVPS